MSEFLLGLRRFSGADVQRNSGPLQEAALREPVAITHHGRPRLVVMNVEEFERLKRRDRRVVRIEDISDEFAAELEKQAGGTKAGTIDWGDDA